MIGYEPPATFGAIQPMVGLWVWGAVVWPVYLDSSLSALHNRLWDRWVN